MAGGWHWWQSKWPPVKVLMQSRLYFAPEYAAVRDRLGKPSVAPSITTSSSAGFLTVDIHIQGTLARCLDKDESVKSSDPEAEALPEGPRDGLAHLFSAMEGQPVPTQLTTIKTGFWIMEVPTGFMARVNRGMFAASSSYFCFATSFAKN